MTISTICLSCDYEVEVELNNTTVQYESCITVSLNFYIWHFHLQNKFDVFFVVFRFVITDICVHSFAVFFFAKSFVK